MVKTSKPDFMSIKYVLMECWGKRSTQPLHYECKNVLSLELTPNSNFILTGQTFTPASLTKKRM